MRTVMLQNIAMGCFFMGAFIVGFPLVMREVFAGSSADLAVLNALNFGLVVSILALLKLGFVARAGRVGYGSGFGLDRAADHRAGE